MSYDIYLKDPVTNETAVVDAKHFMTGGTYAIDGTDELWLNVTYNYSDKFKKVFGDSGIRTIYGLSGAKSLSILEEAISKLKDDVSENYWESTEGNAKSALIKLKTMAEMRPDCIWDGD